MSAEDKHKTIQQVRAFISSWVQPFNAVVLFGGTTVAVLDFLSPKVALLPIASMVAIVGFMVVAMGRKLIGPLGLRHAWLQEILAPEKSFVKAPAVIFTGLLSVLMLSGTAWSSSHRADGGGFARAIPGVRDMQQALGVMQAMHQEQQKQTSLLEEIRDGTSSNPRRVLASQGVMWTDDEFRQAIRRGDVNVVSLFLKGGMLWPLHVVRESLASVGIEKLEGVLGLLAQYPEQIEKVSDLHARSCGYFFESFLKTPSLLESKSLKSLMSRHCSSETDSEVITHSIKYSEERHQEAMLAYEKKMKNLMTKGQCEGELLKDNANAVKREVHHQSLIFPAGVYNLEPSDRTTLFIKIYEELKDSGGVGFFTDKVTKGVRNAIEEYCGKVAIPPARPVNTEGEAKKRVLAWIRG